MRVSHDMTALVSILIPAYNAERWIAETIESALAQTWPHKEIIVVDDGSKDGTLAVARRFLDNDVTVVTQPNQGAAAARNTASELCRGEYIQWLDADDLISPNKIAAQIAIAEQVRNKRMLLSSGWGSFMHRPSRINMRPTPLWADVSPVEWLTRKWEHNAHMQTATWLVSRELTEASGPWNTQLLNDDDGEYFFRVVRASEGIRFVPSELVYYRVTPSNRLSYIGRSDKKVEATFTGMRMQIGYLRAMEDSARVRAACVNYLQTWLPHFYPERPDIVQQAEQLASELGGRLHPPILSWKYAWIRSLFGWSAAKSAQLTYNHYKSVVLRALDKAMMRWDVGRARGV